MDKWSDLRSNDYEIVDLGRPAVFLLPVKKLRWSIGGISIEEDLHRFLIENFGTYTTSKKAVITDECREYRVSFLGKERTPLLLKKLAAIAYLIEEECVYCEAGQYAALVYPKKETV